ncbi:MAG: fluoride efflux transporter FluC, partial [Brachybacterium tyrofermentans]
WWTQVGGSGGGWASAPRCCQRAFGMRLAARRMNQGDVRMKPWLTLLANALACFLLGIAVARLGSAVSGAAELGFLLVGIGFCGGLSTLSTAAMDVVDLIRRDSFAISVGYFLLTIGIGMAALWIGLVIAS